MSDWLILAETAAGVANASSEPKAGWGTLTMLVLFIAGSMWIGLLANRAMSKGSFLKGFFLGNRGLGAWALALTATVQSGGTFMGFPSLVYSHGWTVALWICGYMVVPITGFGILGKRLAQLSRRTGAITIPDLFRSRFNSPMLGLTASLFILFYMSFMMIAQFKAGALVMKLSWPGSGALALSEDASAYTLSAEAHQKLDAAVQPKLTAMVGRDFPDEAAAGEALKSALTPEELKTQKAKILGVMKPFDYLYFVGLAVFTLTVVGYTLLGGFLAAVWTDLFQSIMMWVGVLLLLALTLSAAGGLEHATLVSLDKTGPGYIFGPGYDHSGENKATFMPIGLAASAFCIWVFSGLGSPAGMVRIMASENTTVIRRSIYLLSFYNVCIYIPLILICICGRSLLPDLGAKSDEIIPRLAIITSGKLWGGSLVAGLILAAPFGAVMATVSSYLVVISSGLVRDVYQRFINPEATQHEMRRLSYITMIVVGIAAVIANINPVTYLQAIVVFSGTGAAATFCVPALMLAFWRRATVPGMIASMISGAATVLGLYLLPHLRVLPGLTFIPEQHIGQQTAFRPFYLLTLDPILWGLAASLIVGIVVCLVTRPPDDGLVRKLFDAEAKA